ncbi:ABC transporter permease, partial [uncultured Ruminococcus sp.]|uniref:ABC transporter permease n=1 Tax=uncultured Ruminococcus sp. TaxID=165186 RepID=UPI0025FE569D
GEGLSDSMFRLELSPFVMAVSFGCAMFSIFFSSYADAMRVKRLPPIQSVGYGKKTRGGRPSKWRSRRILGYPRAFTLKCISKQKVRFCVTMLSALISGIFIMTFIGITNISDKDKEYLIPLSTDIIINTEKTDLDTQREQFEKLKASGLFEDVLPNAFIFLHNEGSDDGKDYNEEYYTDDMKRYLDKIGRDMPSLSLSLIDRDNFEKNIICDMTYDEFIASGKPIFCDTLFGDYYSENMLKEIKKEFGVKECYEGVYEQHLCRLDAHIFKDGDIATLSFGMRTRETDENGKPKFGTQKITLDFGGKYTTVGCSYASSYGDIIALMPYDGFTLDKLGAENAELLEDRFTANGFDLSIKEGCADRARSLINNEYDSEGSYIEDFLTTKQYNERKVKALRIAGMGFALSLAAVVLLNIYSTTRANMINRCRDFAMMRSCGMSMKQIRKSLFFEARLYAVITTLISSVAGWVMALLICGIADTEENYSLIPSLMLHFPWQGSLLVFAVIMLTMAAAFLPAFYRMKKQDIANEIRTEI